MTIRKMLPSADESRTLLSVSARSGQAVGERPDLVMVDVLGPRLTPLAACRVLQSPGDARSIPVNLLTTGARRAAQSANDRCWVGPVWILARHARGGGGSRRSDT